MTVEKALAIFAELEPARLIDDGEYDHEEDPALLRFPTYDVRLDAVTDRSTADRHARIRVTAGKETGGIGLTDWKFVLDIADRHEVTTVDIANDGIELS